MTLLNQKTFNRNANDIINLIIIEHYQNDYKGQLFKTNDKEYPIVSNIKDYLTKKTPPTVSTSSAPQMTF